MSNIHRQSNPVISQKVNLGNNPNASSSPTGFIRNNKAVLQPNQENRLNTMTPAAGGSSGSRANPFSKGVGFGTRSGTVRTTSYPTTSKIVTPVPVPVSIAVPETKPTSNEPLNTRAIFNFGGSGMSSPLSSQQNTRPPIGTSQSSRNEAQAPSNQPDLDTSFNADDFLDADLFDFLDESDSPSTSGPSSTSNQVTPPPPKQSKSTALGSQNKPVVGNSTGSKHPGPISAAQQKQQQPTPIVINTARRSSPTPSYASSTPTKSKIEPQEHVYPRRSSPTIPKRPARAVSIPAESAGNSSSWTGETHGGEGSSRPRAFDTIDIRGGPQLNLIDRINVEDRQGQTGARRSKSSSSLPSDKRERRRIPGPAGNLPKLTEAEKDALFSTKTSRRGGTKASAPTRTASATMNTRHTGPISALDLKILARPKRPRDSIFVSGAWEEMLTAYNLPGYKPSTLDIYKGIDPWITTTISDILSQEWHVKSKIERLVVMVKSFTLSEMDASVTLLDPSGEMRGTMHRQVLEENNKDKEIRVGTVLALKRVAVFSFSSASLYLNITAHNIDRIFQPKASVYLLSQESSPRSGGSQCLSSPDLTQRKRRLAVEHSSPDGHGPSGAILVSSSCEQLSNTKSQNSISSIGSSPLKRRVISPSLTPDWASTQPQPSQNPFVQRPDARAQGSSAPHSTRAENSQDRVQSSQELHQLSPIISSQESEHGVQFQSLMPTFGHGSNKAPYQPSQIATPIFSVGAPTPLVPPAPVPVTSSVTPRTSLASFAAPANIRKRSSPKSSSSGTPPSESPSLGSVVAPSFVQGSGRSDINQSSGPQSSLDWPDDLDDIIFEEEFVAAPLQRTSATNNDTIASNAKQAPPQPQLQPQPQPQLQLQQPPTVADDDLDLLFGGLDDNELLDDF
ncbi:MAG: hypothetical protein BYD32DRAFT_243934 [Podila humilis]|nr:MAG: hypothetical protein BYD32DRAFT_243934 [Podila humilis]